MLDFLKFSLMKRTISMILLGLGILATSYANSHAATRANKETATTQMQDEGVFVIYETQPEFPGGMAELMKYIQKNIQYPSICKEKRLQGRVIVQFVVNTDSTINDVQVIKPVNPYFDKEAIRLVKSMPKWKPGEQYGKPVQVRFTLPVTFRLPKEETVKTDSLATSTNK
jgi:TonB family protein